jgi:hypothetical protein
MQIMVSVRGKRQVDSVATGEKSVNAILEAYVFASGTLFPPL